MCWGTYRIIIVKLARRPLPSHPEQCRISSNLDAVDANKYFFGTTSPEGGVGRKSDEPSSPSFF